MFLGFSGKNWVNVHPIRVRVFPRTLRGIRVRPNLVRVLRDVVRVLYLGGFFGLKVWLGSVL